MTDHQTPPSVPTDEMVEAAAYRFIEVYFRNAPDDTLIDVEEVERAMLSASPPRSQYSQQRRRGTNP